MPNWTPECSEAIAECKRAQRLWKGSGDIDDLVRYQQAKRHRAKCISADNRETHRQKVSQVKDEKGLWVLAKWARNRSITRHAYTLAIKTARGLAQTTDAKAAAFQAAFFPKPLEADLADI